MKRNTIKWRIFKYNIIVIIILIALTTLIFNIAIRLYIENDITKQLSLIGSRAEDTALHKGPNFFPPKDERRDIRSPKPSIDVLKDKDELFRFYFMLDRSLREPLSLLNADYLLLDSNKEIIISPEEEYFTPSNDILNKIKSEINRIDNTNNQVFMNFVSDGTEYTSIIKPVSGKNTFGLGWIIIYSSLQKVNQLQWGINIILFVILVLSSLIIALYSSLAAKKISAPFSSLNDYLSDIAERKFGNRINMSVDDELQEFVNNINTISEKLESYDSAQKTFLQNASHEFRTPLMSIQSHAEGIKYDVIDHKAASDIIIDETKRMTHLVEDLLYLSRLDTIEENYRFVYIDFNYFLKAIEGRMMGIAAKNKINIVVNSINENIKIFADEEKLSRAFTNIISNCIRYAKTTVCISCGLSDDKKLEITIYDDGEGFDTKELPYIFERFYKGKKGNFGLGLAISKNVIEKHSGKISASNLENGAIFKIDLPIK